MIRAGETKAKAIRPFLNVIGHRMAVIICQRLMKLFPPTWQHHRLMIVSTIVWILQFGH